MIKKSKLIFLIPGIAIFLGSVSLYFTFMVHSFSDFQNTDVTKISYRSPATGALYETTSKVEIQPLLVVLNKVTYKRVLIDKNVTGVSPIILYWDSKQTLEVQFEGNNVTRINGTPYKTSPDISNELSQILTVIRSDKNKK